jgi:F420-dependent methylenetetrahydromethanopterin dehydrogenase
VTDRSKSMIDGLRSENPYSTIQSPALDGVAAKIKQLDAEKKRIEKDIEQLKNQVRLAMEKVGADLIQGDKYRILNKKYLTITENR